MENEMTTTETTPEILDQASPAADSDESISEGERLMREYLATPEPDLSDDEIADQAIAAEMNKNFGVTDLPALQATLAVSESETEPVTEDNAAAEVTTDNLSEDEFAKVLAEIVSEAKADETKKTSSPKPTKAVKSTKLAKKSNRGRGRPAKFSEKVFVEVWARSQTLDDVIENLHLEDNKASRLYVSMRASTLRKKGTILKLFPRGRKPQFVEEMIAEEKAAETKVAE